MSTFSSTDIGLNDLVRLIAEWVVEDYATELSATRDAATQDCNELDHDERQKPS